MEEETGLVSAEAAEYTYLTLPPDEALRSCIGLVLAGLAARAKIGVAGLEEAIEILEDQHSANGSTRFRFSLKDESLIAEVEKREQEAVRVNGTASGWRTVVEMVS